MNPFVVEPVHCPVIPVHDIAETVCRAGKWDLEVAKMPGGGDEGQWLRGIRTVDSLTGLVQDLLEALGGM